MNCADARHRLLNADLSVIRGESDTSLREHLAGCARCAAEASVILADTARLRQALVARQRQPLTRWSRKRRFAVSLIPVALAAEITLLAFLSNRDMRIVAPQTRLDDSVYSTAPSGRDSEFAVARRIAAPKPTSAGAPFRAPRLARLAPADVIDNGPMKPVRVSAGDQAPAGGAASSPRIPLQLFSRGDSL